MKRKLAILNLLALLATIAVNYMSNTGTIGGRTIKEVSDRLPTLITPAPYAFAIWGVIYFGLFSFVLAYLGHGTEKTWMVDRIGWWFILSCGANCGWIIAWVTGHIGLSVVAMSVLLSTLIRIVYLARMELDYVPFRRLLFIWWPFSLYIGWIITAAVVNAAAWLVNIEWSGFGIPAMVWAILVLVVAGSIYQVLIWRRNMRETALAGVWALVGVGVADRATAPGVSYVAFGIAIMVLAGAILHRVRSARQEVRCNG